METQALSGLNPADFQKEIDGKKTDLFFLRNIQGNEVAITNYGGTIVAIMVPDRNGKHTNVIQAHDNIDASFLPLLVATAIVSLADVFN